MGRQFTIARLMGLIALLAVLLGGLVAVRKLDPWGETLILMATLTLFGFLLYGGFGGLRPRSDRLQAWRIERRRMVEELRRDESGPKDRSDPRG